MTKEEFRHILERQQKSGLSIKDFCENETYPQSSFHYWKSKYGFVHPAEKPDNASLSSLSPIRITPGSIPLLSATNQIEVELLCGIKVRLNNITDLHLINTFLSQTLDRYVLPE